jgi:iron complex outermembrane receptor protein
VRGPLSADQNELVTAVGAFIQNETGLGERGELTLGLRHDEVRFDVTDRFLADGDESGRIIFDEVSPMAGLAFRYNDSSRLYATISTAFETPTTTEFANPAGGGFNQSLTPQESTNYEIGFKSRGDEYRLETALFHIDVEDELTPFELPDRPGRSFFENAGASERDGLELAVTRRLGRGMELSAAYTWSDFVFKRFRDESGATFDGNRIPGIPEHLIHVEWSWFAQSGIYVLWDATYTGGFFADNGNEDEVDSYTVSNVRLGYTGFFGDWEVAPFLGINNIFDEEYNSNIRINAFGGRYFEPAPTRNFYVGITIRRNFED